jgi:hypothetical protein
MKDMFRPFLFCEFLQITYFKKSIFGFETCKTYSCSNNYFIFVFFFFVQGFSNSFLSDNSDISKSSLLFLSMAKSLILLIIS